MPRKTYKFDFTDKPCPETDCCGFMNPHPKIKKSWKCSICGLELWDGCPEDTSQNFICLKAGIGCTGTMKPLPEAEEGWRCDECGLELWKKIPEVETILDRLQTPGTKELMGLSGPITKHGGSSNGRMGRKKPKLDKDGIYREMLSNPYRKR